MTQNRIPTEPQDRLVQAYLNLKKKAVNIDTLEDEKNDANIKDPLKNQKAIVKYYGLSNRLK